MSKYEPLEVFLRSLEKAEWRADFYEVRKLLGFDLPKSAFKYPAWWSNDETGHSHARAWLNAGWRTTHVDLAAERVTFVRAAAVHRPATPSGADPWGCMAGSVRIMPGVDLTAPSGEQWNAEKGLLVNE